MVDNMTKIIDQMLFYCHLEYIMGHTLPDNTMALHNSNPGREVGTLRNCHFRLDLRPLAVAAGKYSMRYY
jgi:hypothetical protein